MKEADFVGKQISVKSGDTELTATYVANSLSGGKANFLLDGGKTLTDASTYTVTSDSFNFTNGEFVAKVAAAYVKSFDKVTSDVRAAYDSNNKPQSVSQDIVFAAKNQYGEAIKVDSVANMKLSVKYKGMPLTSEVSGFKANADGTVQFTLNTTLAQGENVEVTLTNYDKDPSANDAKVIGSSTFDYTVVKGENPTATSISSLDATYSVDANGHKKDAAVTDVLAGDKLTLNADVRDQYNNKSDDQNLRWVVTEGKDLVSSASLNSDGIYDATTGVNTLSLDVNKPGKFSVDVYNTANGAKKTYSVEIGASKLSTITATNETVETSYNNEDIKLVKIVQNDGAVLTPDMLKANVVAKTAGTTSDDVNVSFALRGGDVKATANDIIMTVKTSKPGTYEITPYVGAQFDANAVKTATPITVTTTINQEPKAVNTVTLEDFKTNEVTATSPVTKAISFTNIHGEAVDVKAKDLKVLPTANLDVKFLDKDKKEIASPSSSESVVKYLQFTASEKGSYTATIVVGGTSKQVNITAVDAPSIKEVTLGQQAVSVIKNDALDEATPSDEDSTVMYEGKAYKAVPVTFKDQYGNAMPITSGDYTITALDADGNVLTGVDTVFLKSLSNAAVAGSSDEVKYIGIAADSTATSGNLIVTVTNKTDSTKTANATLTITTQAERSLNSLSVTPSTGVAAVNGQVTYTVTGLDQYSRAFELNKNLVKVVPASNGEYTVLSTDYNAKDPKSIDVTVQGNKASTDSLVFYYDNGNTANTLETTEKSVNAQLKVQQSGDVIKSVAIQPTASVEPNGVDAYNVDLSKYKAQVTKHQSNTITFSAKAFDGSNNEVALPSSGQYYYSVVKNDLKYATTTDAKPSADFGTGASANVLTINGTGANEDISGSITVRALNIATGLTSDMTINVDSQEAKAQDGTYYLANASTDKTDSALTSLSLKESDATTTNGVRTVKVLGIDQYGQIQPVTPAAVGADSTAYFTVDPSTNEITLTAKAAGTANLRVVVDGNNILTVPVTVDADAVSGRTLSLTAGGVTNGSYVTSAQNRHVTVDVNLAGTTPAVGDTLELQVDGQAFASPVTKTITQGDIDAGTVEFSDITLPGDDGAKVLTAVLKKSDGTVKTTTATPLTLNLKANGPEDAILESANIKTNDVTPNVVVTAEKGSKIVVYDDKDNIDPTDDVELGTGTGNGTSPTTVTLKQLSEGVHNLKVKVVDGADQESIPVALTINVDITSPTVEGIETKDVDGNGKVDHIVVTYSEALNGATLASTDLPTVSGYTVLSAKTDADGSVVADGDGANGNYLVIKVQEGSAADYTATPTVTLKANVLDDLANNPFLGLSQAAENVALAPTSIAVTGNNDVTLPVSGGQAATETLAATVKDQYGVGMTGESVTWSIQGTAPTGVSIDPATGDLTVTDQASAGTVTVVATDGTVTKTADVKIVKAASAATSIAVTGNSDVTLPAIGGQAVTETLAATVKDQYGVNMNGETVSWSIQGAAPTGVSIDPATGDLTVTDQASAGTVTVVATDGTVTKTADVKIVKAASAATSIVVTGNSDVTLPASGSTSTETLAATVKDQYGVDMNGETVSWSIQGTAPTGVSIDPATGILTVTDQASAGTVTVVATDGTVTGTADVILK